MYVIARDSYLRALGIIYLAAFVSFAVQVQGLIGSHGALPIVEFIAMAGERLGWERFYLFPTLAWLASSDIALSAYCWLGAALSAALVAGFFSRYAAALAWVLYLSLVNAGNVFMGYQWESLLLEAGFLAILAAPGGRWLSAAAAAVPKELVFLHRFLLFRLFVSSGFAKLLSGDPTWRDLTAMAFHFETQPLPTWVAWYAHHLPLWLLQGMGGAMFFAECALPFLFFGPPRARCVAFVIEVGLQMGILLTGNYTYFNWLTMALCLWLLDDKQMMRVIPLKRTGALPRSSLALRWLAVVLLSLGLCQLLSLLRVATPFMESALTAVERFRLVNGYGLFAVMTTERDELVLEGSRDGKEWLAYELPWKPGDPSRRPGFVAPHQPRLDWQAWFAALGHFSKQRWLHGVMERIFEGRPEVLGLLAGNPFPDEPPKFLRVQRYRYRFAAPEARRRGLWWERTLQGAYGPVVSARE